MEERVYLSAVYKVGKIKSKYLIIEILAYSIQEFTFICKLLHYSSRSMRDLVIKNYFLMMNILFETH